MSDLTLAELPYFTGTEQYHNVTGVNVTDGVAYLMENGYAWFVTDVIAVLRLHAKVKTQPFVSVKLAVKNGSAVVTYDDGNDKVLHSQTYTVTDAKRDVTLFFTDGVLMLAGEY